MAPKSGLVTVTNNFAKFMKGVEAMTNKQVMVGVPDDKTERREGEISNAALAYIHDRGSPEANIPARPFMEPGIKEARAAIQMEMENAGKAVLGGTGKVETYLNRIGLIATRAIKNVISAGIAPPLAPSTILGRIRRVKGKKRRAAIDAALAAGTPESRQNGVEGVFTPLKVTNQLFNAITYVIRDVRKKR